MKSGLGDRNNPVPRGGRDRDGGEDVSMKSGLGDRNNESGMKKLWSAANIVSMKSGLGDRNNQRRIPNPTSRPRVSMKSGLGDRNNCIYEVVSTRVEDGLNEVRSWRPEQSA